MNEIDIIKLDELSRKEKVKQDAEKIRRPSLVKRIASGLLDILFIAVLLVLIELLVAYTIFKPLGYFDAKDTIDTLSDQSGLYVKQNGLNVLVYNATDQPKTPDEKYNNRITNYYATDARAVAEGKLAAYNQAKLDSGLFVTDSSGAVVVKADALNDDLNAFYKKQYDQAIDFLALNPAYVKAANATFQIMVYSIFVSFLVSAAVFYFIIPLVRKDGATLGQLICKIRLMDARSNRDPHKWQVAMRSFMVLVLNYLVPFFIFVIFSYFTLITVLVTFAIMCLMKNNRGVPDLASLTDAVSAVQLEHSFSLSPTNLQ